LSFVDQQGEWKMVANAEFVMTLSALRVDAKDHGVLLAEIGPGVAELAELAAADEGVIARIEDQDDILPAQSRQPDLLASL